MEELVRMVKELDDGRLEHLAEGVEINRRAAEYGLENSPAMALGSGLASLAEEGIGDHSLASKVAQYVAAAADSRMGGGMIHIKGCAGSGNHGITFFLTVGLAYERYREKAVRSLGRTLAMGLLIVRYVKAYTGLLTPTCGVTVSAAPAAAAAIVYALGGTPRQMTAAVKLIYGNIAGILCDGAKHGCSLKSSTSARTAIEAAFLALRGVEIPESDGIVDRDLPSSMEQLRRLQNEGLMDADRTMLDILTEKAGRLDGSV
jgi:L-cysteine desulfidase